MTADLTTAYAAATDILARAEQALTLLDIRANRLDGDAARHRRQAEHCPRADRAGHLHDAEIAQARAAQARDGAAAVRAAMRGHVPTQREAHG